MYKIENSAYLVRIKQKTSEKQAVCSSSVKKWWKPVLKARALRNALLPRNCTLLQNVFYPQNFNHIQNAFSLTKRLETASFFAFESFAKKNRGSFCKIVTFLNFPLQHLPNENGTYALVVTVVAVVVVGASEIQFEVKKKNIQILRQNDGQMCVSCTTLQIITKSYCN